MGCSNCEALEYLRQFLGDSYERIWSKRICFVTNPESAVIETLRQITEDLRHYPRRHTQIKNYLMDQLIAYLCREPAAGEVDSQLSDKNLLLDARAGSRWVSHVREGGERSAHALVRVRVPQILT